MIAKKIKPTFAWVVMADNGHIYCRYGGDIIAGRTRAALASHYHLTDPDERYVRVRITPVTPKRKVKK